MPACHSLNYIRHLGSNPQPSDQPLLGAIYASLDFTEFTLQLQHQNISKIIHTYTQTDEKNMPQIVYTAPLSAPLRMYTMALCGLSAALSWFLTGFESPLTKTLVNTFSTLQILNFFFDPEMCYIWYTRRDPENGTVKIKVIRPLIGFRRCETQIGLTGSYEVRDDGWSYECALIRI